MKIRSLLLLLLAVCFLGGSTAAQKKTGVNDLRSMVETERAFARMSEEKGTREAFVAFIADEGILFRPTPVLGKKWMQENPLPPSTTRPLLAWQPIFAFVSSAGDLGYTTGPWQYKKDIKDAEPAAFGNFLTVWKKQADGSWKFAIDLGISNPQPDKVIAQWQPSPNNYQRAKARQTDVESEQAALRERDRECSNLSATRDAQTAFNSFATPDVRTLRNEKFPFV